MTDLILGSEEQRLELAIITWLDAKSKRSGSEKTATAYRATLQSFRSHLFTQRLDLDGPAQAVALLAQQWAGLGSPAPATYNQRLAIISSFYAYAMKHDLLASNPMGRVDRRPVQPSIRSAYSSPEKPCRSPIISAMIRRTRQQLRPDMALERTSPRCNLVLNHA